MTAKRAARHTWRQLRIAAKTRAGAGVRRRWWAQRPSQALSAAC